jgi:hypothetical protein
MVDNTRSLPDLPLYHPLSELATRPGYYPNLTEAQINAIYELKEMILKENISLTDPHDPEHETFKLLRFLRARQWNLPNAFQMLKNDLEWRSNETRKDLKHLSAADVLQCDLNQLFKRLPTWVQGFDRQCRPVAWKQFGKLEIWKVLKLVSMETLLNFHAWEADQALRLMSEQSVATGYNIETFVVVIDAAHWHLGLATSDAYAFIRGMSVTDSDHYPERLGKLIVVNAPTTLSIAWKIVKGFLDPVTLAKINIFSKKSEWLPALLSIMDEDQIPAHYGGTAKDLTVEEALQSMDPPQALNPSSALLKDEKPSAVSEDDEEDALVTTSASAEEEDPLVNTPVEEDSVNVSAPAEVITPAVPVDVTAAPVTVPV